MTIIRKKNFRAMALEEIPLADEYINCNFGRAQPDLTGPDAKGHRLFPGDDTPRVFRQCNLMNCEPPPGSTLDSCMTGIMETNVIYNTETVEIDGVIISTTDFVKNTVYGRILEDGTYEYKPTPEDVFVT